MRTDAASGKVALSAGRNLVMGKEVKGEGRWEKGKTRLTGTARVGIVRTWEHFGGKVVVLVNQPGV